MAPNSDILDEILGTATETDPTPPNVKGKMHFRRKCDDYARAHGRDAYLWKEDRRRYFPLGIPQALLNQELDNSPNINEEIAARLRAHEGWAEFVTYDRGWHDGEVKEITAKWVESYLQDYEFLFLTRSLTPSQILQFNHESPTYNSLRIGMEGDPIYALYLKIANAAWRWGWGTMPWGDVIKARNFLKNFTFGGEGFAIHIDHTEGCSAFSYAEWNQELYIDGALAFVITYEGKHVLTIGFSFAMVPNEDGVKEPSVLIQQIQTRQKKGNRWLYDLSKPLWDYAMERILKGCRKSGLTPYLVDGESWAQKEDATFNKSAEDRGYNDPEHIAAWAEKVAGWREARPRVVNFYAQPVEGYERSTHTFTAHSVTFQKLNPNPPPSIKQKQERS